MKRLEDIDLSKNNVDKHIFILKAGTPVYRAIIGSYDPKIPTGQENRFAKNPYNINPQQFQELFVDGQTITCGTGNACCSFFPETCLKEIAKRHGVDKLQFAVVHKIIFEKDIPTIDTISLCLSSEVDPTPREDHPFWHSFYGPPIRAQALKIKSSVDLDGENIVFFPDNIPDYLNIVSSEKDKRESIKGE